MRRVVPIMLWTLGCGGGGEAQDARSHDGAASDARTDAGPDGGGCAGPDTDSDGICDVDDLCPQDYDPAQLDLDGDGHGWMCDDNESLLVEGDSSVAPLAMMLDSADIFEAVFQLGCTTSAVCQNRVVVAGPSVAYVAASAGDAWLDVPFVYMPERTIDGDLVFARRLDATSGAVDVGRLDPVARTFTPFAMPPPAGNNGPSNVHLGDRAMLLELASTDGEGMYEPVPSGEPRLVGTAARFQLGPPDQPQVINSGAPVGFVEPRDAAGHRTLQSFSPGQPALVDVTAGGSPVGPWTTLTQYGRVNDTLFYVGRRADNGQYEHILVTHDGATVYPLTNPPHPDPRPPRREAVHDGLGEYSLGTDRQPQSIDPSDRG